MKTYQKDSKSFYTHCTYKNICERVVRGERIRQF